MRFATAELQARLSTLSPLALQEVDALVSEPPDFLYQHRPVDWLVDVLEMPRETLVWSTIAEYAKHAWDGTIDPLAAICEAIANGQDCGVESATGTGKTYLAAGLALWFVACFEDALVITTAPVEKQLTAQLWKEIGRHWPKFSARYPRASTVQLRVRMSEGDGESERWAILGYACGVDAGAESATRAQGFHAAHMLIVTEETPGIDQAVMKALANTCTGDHNIRLALGNPDSQLDALHQFCVQANTVHVRISALDHPNVVTGREVIPGAVGRKSIANRLAAADGNADDPFYQSRVRGISPAEATDALIKLAWCNAAALRWENRTITGDDFPALGVDVAQSEAGDKAAIARWFGNCLAGVESKRCPNATMLGYQVAAEAKKVGIAAQHIGVDMIGVGAATVNAMRERGFGALAALNSGSAPRSRIQKTDDGRSMEWVPDANEHRNLRGQMWWQMREDLRLGRIDLPHDPELFRQLTMPRYERKGSVVVLEEKAQTRKRLGRSPDDADAVVYGNWVRPRAAVEGEGRIVPEDVSPGFDLETRRMKPRTPGRTIEPTEDEGAPSRVTTLRFGGTGAKWKRGDDD